MAFRSTARGARRALVVAKPLRLRMRAMSTNEAFATKASKHYDVAASSLSGLSTPIVTATTYRLASASAGAKLCEADVLPEGDPNGYLYSRWGSPTTHAVARAISELEGASAGTLIFASGMAAITTSFLSVLKSGDHVVAPKAVYGGTHEFLSSYAERWGIAVSFIDPTEPAAAGYKRAMRPNTRVLYAETPCNPTMRLTDLAAVGAISKSAGTLFLVDGTFGSPYNQQALSIPGVDVSIHSATKYLGGHSDLLAGTVSSNSKSFMRELSQAQKLLGGTLPAFDSFLIGRGLKTLDVRMERHNRTAMRVARFLEQHRSVERVHYPGLESHPDHQLAKRQMIRGFGGMMSFEVKGGEAAGKKLVESLKVINLAVSLGATESLIEHPASMTHTMVPAAEREAGGIRGGLVRLSLGLEDVADLEADLKQALDKL